MTKYVVICYALHERRIVSYDVFDSKREAASFLAKDAKKLMKKRIIMEMLLLLKQFRTEKRNYLLLMENMSGHGKLFQCKI